MMVGTISNNLYYNGRTSGGAWQLNNSAYSTLSAWQSACGCDASPSLVSNPLMGSSYFPALGPPAIQLGANLTSLGLAPLDIDAKGNPRPSSGAWMPGAYQSSGNAGAQRHLWGFRRSYNRIPRSKVGDLFDTAPLHFLAHSGFDGIAFLFFPSNSNS